MRRLLWFLLALLLAGGDVGQAKTEPIPSTRFIAYGDDEGVNGRPYTDNTGRAPIYGRLKEILDRRCAEIDGILHTGDFVRYDPKDSRGYLNFIRAECWQKFYPTIGGDGEFLHEPRDLGRYQRMFAKFVKQPEVSHLQEAIDRTRETPCKTPLEWREFHYATRIQNVHLVVLHNPDEYGKTDKRFRAWDPHDRKGIDQVCWLEEILAQIDAQRDLEKEVVIVLSHRPVFNRAGGNQLMRLFTRRRVDLVLSGDKHVYAAKPYAGSLPDGSRWETLYLVTGIAGDYFVGGCDDPTIAHYRGRCRPRGALRGFGNPEARLDHYVEIQVNGGAIDLRAVRLLDGQPFESWRRAPGQVWKLSP